MDYQAFVSSRVNSLLSRYARAQGSLRPPIEPEKLIGLCSVLSIEHRPMVPEGVLTPVPGGFRIYIQSNFANHSGNSSRRRFTLAHELAHTFFYDLADGNPKRKRGAPRGSSLERLCHVGATQILVPEILLRRELQTAGEVASVEDILNLAGTFHVSAEVMMRQLHDRGLIPGEKFAAILVDSGEGNRRLIAAACYGSMLLCNATSPKRGSDFDIWVRQLLPSPSASHDPQWVRRTQSATITGSKLHRSRRSFILGLNFAAPSS